MVSLCVCVIVLLQMAGSSEPLELRTENALMVSQSLAVSIDQFFDVQEMFLANLAFLLGVPTSRIVVRTSTMYAFHVYWLQAWDLRACLHGHG